MIIVIINNKEYDINDLIKINEDYLKKSKSGIMLNDNEKYILNKYHISYNNYTNLKDLVFEIERVIFDSYGDVDDLEKLSMDLSERSYYTEVNK